MPRYVHRDNRYFRLGSCSTCGEPTFHRPLEHTRASGRAGTRWQCEGCGGEAPVLEPVENELEVFAAYVADRYLADGPGDVASRVAGTGRVGHAGGDAPAASEPDGPDADT